MAKLYNTDYLHLSKEDQEEKNKIDNENTFQITPTFSIQTGSLANYPKVIRHYLSLFPNNYLDVILLKDVDNLHTQCNGFHTLLDTNTTTELQIKRYIQDNGYYHIPASIFNKFNFGHHEACLFKEFQLGTRYRADYLLVGKASGGWQFIFVEFEAPYGNIILNNGNWGESVRKGINQVEEWKHYIEGNYASVYDEFSKHTNKPLPKEFISFDSTRMHYVVVAGRRADFENEVTRLNQRRSYHENNILVLHYDNILEDARNLIGAVTY